MRTGPAELVAAAGLVYATRRIARSRPANYPGPGIIANYGLPWHLPVLLRDEPVRVRVL